MLAKIDSEAARLTLSIQLPASQQERVKEVVKNRALTNRDRRMIFEQIGEDLDFTAGAIVAPPLLQRSLVLSDTPRHYFRPPTEPKVTGSNPVGRVRFGWSRPPTSVPAPVAAFPQDVASIV